MVYQLLQTEEFRSWFSKQPPKTQLIITARFERLQQEGHWGFVNRFDDLSELNWTSGMRIYTSFVDSKLVIILAGGNKNGQSQDIKKAKRILEKILKSF